MVQLDMITLSKAFQYELTVELDISLNEIFDKNRGAGLGGRRGKVTAKRLCIYAHLPNELN